jgi:hypothetical protein
MPTQKHQPSCHKCGGQISKHINCLGTIKKFGYGHGRGPKLRTIVLARTSSISLLYYTMFSGIKGRGTERSVILKDLFLFLQNRKVE